MKIQNGLMAMATCLCSTACLAQMGGAKSTAPVTKPNVLVILLDDVGYSDLGCYGSEINTPNIDRLAENGIRYRTFYNNARSAPTRAALMTGLYPHQVGVGRLGSEPGYPNYQGYPNPKNVFIPATLKEAGYFSVMTGKWHLGYDKGVTPITRGFDRSLNAPFGGFYFSDDNTKKKNGTPTSEKNLYLNDESITFSDTRLPQKWYSTHLWVDFGLKFVDQAIEKDKPFFWYLAHNGAHFPLQAPAETIAKYKGKYMAGWEKTRLARRDKQLEMGLFSADNPLTPRNPQAPDWDKLTQAERERYDTQMAIYAATIEEVDRSVGRVIAHLKEKGVYENTMIILMSDNGGNGEPGIEGRLDGENPGAVGSNVFLGAAWADVANTPFFLYKHHAHEGGCNTPLIISYPAAIAPQLRGSIDKVNYGHVTDIMPTVIEVCDGKYPDKSGAVNIPPMEGISLVPSFSGKELVRTKPIIVEHEGNKMLRDGDWKVVQENKEPLWRLYNMKNDPTEMANLASKNPKKLAEMIEKYKGTAARTGVESAIEFNIGKWYSPVDKYLK